ncbi:DNA helicase [Batrachochytrium dendrobatidis]|nr:DNA helicase [Batrachochytrium dendrobatidis]KAK5670818.1 DNA helicase [Batrachochytrium dendrobatidis]
MSQLSQRSHPTSGGSWVRHQNHEQHPPLKQLEHPQLIWQTTSTPEMAFASETLTAGASAMMSTGGIHTPIVNQVPSLYSASSDSPPITTASLSTLPICMSSSQSLYTKTAGSALPSQGMYPNGFITTTAAAAAAAEGGEHDSASAAMHDRLGHSRNMGQTNSLPPLMSYGQHLTTQLLDVGSTPNLGWITDPSSQVSDKDSTWASPMVDIFHSQSGSVEQRIDATLRSAGFSNGVQVPQLTIPLALPLSITSGTSIESNPISADLVSPYDSSLGSAGIYEPCTFPKQDGGSAQMLMYLHPPTKAASTAQPSSRASSKFYALRISRCPGIYRTWAKAKSLIDGCAGARYKSFPTISEAVDFIREQFPDCTFTQNENGEYIMDDSSVVDRIVEEARAKKDKLGGIVLDTQSADIKAMPADISTTVQAWESDLCFQHTLNADQQSILTHITNGSNVYISGKRGVGKRTLMLHIKSFLARSNKAFAVTSACSIRSLQQDVQSTQTWMGIGKAVGTRKQILAKVRKNPITRKNWIDSDALIVLDSSSFSAHLFDVADFLGRQLRKQFDRPFGGMQIILCGDLFDLPPSLSGTISCVECGQGHKIFPDPENPIGDTAAPGAILECVNQSCRAVFQNMWTMFAFEAHSWATANMIHFELKQTYNSDEQLDNLMNDLLDVTISADSRKLLQSLHNDGSLNELDAIEIVPTDQDAATINDAYLAGVANDVVTFDAQDTLLKTFDFTSRGQLRDGPTDDRLDLKIGAPVFLFPKTNSSTPILGQVYGFVAVDNAMREHLIAKLSCKHEAVTQSTLEWIKKHKFLPQILLHQSGNGSVQNTHQQIITVEPHIWCVKAHGKVVSWRIHLPMRLAYAVSVQKSRGLAFPNVKISSIRHWATGSAYIALSRAGSFKGIHCSDMHPNAFLPNEIVLAFKTCSPSGSLSATVTSRLQPPCTPRITNLASARPVAKLRSGGTKRPRLIGIPMSNSGIFPSLSNDDINFGVLTNTSMDDLRLVNQQNHQLPSPMLSQQNMNGSTPLQMHATLISDDSQISSPNMYCTETFTPLRSGQSMTSRQQQMGAYQTPRHHQLRQLPQSLTYLPYPSQLQPQSELDHRRNSFHGISGMANTSLAQSSPLSIGLQTPYQQNYSPALQTYQNPTKRRQVYQQVPIALNTGVSATTSADISYFGLSPQLSAPTSQLPVDKQSLPTLTTSPNFNTFISPDTLTKKFRPSTLSFSANTLTSSLPHHFTGVESFGLNTGDWSSSTINSSNTDSQSSLGPISSATSLSEPFGSIFFDQPVTRANSIQ